MTDDDCGAGFFATVSSTAACAAAPCVPGSTDQAACCTAVPSGCACVEDAQTAVYDGWMWRTLTGLAKATANGNCEGGTNFAYALPTSGFHIVDGSNFDNAAWEKVRHGSAFPRSSGGFVRDWTRATRSTMLRIACGCGVGRFLPIRSPGRSQKSVFSGFW